MLFLACIDSFYLLQIIADYLANVFNMDIRMISPDWCRFFVYFNFCICPMSSWSLVFINAERMTSITAPSYITVLFSKRKFQLSLIAAIIIWDLIYYSPFIYFNNWMSTADNSTNETFSECSFTDETASQVLPLMDLFNSTLVPFTILISTSSYSIYYLFRSRVNHSIQMPHG